MNLNHFQGWWDSNPWPLGPIGDIYVYCPLDFGQVTKVFSLLFFDHLTKSNSVICTSICHRFPIWNRVIPSMSEIGIFFSNSLGSGSERRNCRNESAENFSQSTENRSAEKIQPYFMRFITCVWMQNFVFICILRDRPIRPKPDDRINNTLSTRYGEQNC